MKTEIYVHHKGGRYAVLFRAKDSTNETAGRDLVVYLSLTTGAVHVRTTCEWGEFVEWPDGRHMPRFVREAFLAVAAPEPERKP